jgi:hypothetical protein
VEWSWIALAGIEMGWVLGVWLLLAEKNTPRTGGKVETPSRPPPTRIQVAFAWAYFVYHLPLLLLDYLTTGWWQTLLQGRGGWALIEAAIIGALTVTAYGVALDWVSS